MRQTDREIQKQGLREDVRAWEIVHVSILELSGFEESLSWQAEVTGTPCTEKRTICYKSVCRRNEGKMHEKKRRGEHLHAHHLAL